MNMISEEELSRLNDWVNLRDENKIIYQKLQQPDFMQNLINWLKEQKLKLYN